MIRFDANRKLPRIFALALICFVTPEMSAADEADWTTYRGNNHRSAVSEVEVDTSRLALLWKHEARARPSPAWAGPARWDAFNGHRNLPSMRNYDLCYQPVASEEIVLFGSSSDDSVCALDETSGKVLWRFNSGGPIRIAPTIHESKVYFGSDDGRAYCVSLKSGKLVWSFCAREFLLQSRKQGAHERVLNDGRIISFWPVRTGVVVHQGQAIFAASLLPWRESYLCSVDAESGLPSDKGYVLPVADQTFEGAMAVANDTLIAPQGRVPPKFFSALTGKYLGGPRTGGGSFAVVTPDQLVITGGSTKKPTLVKQGQDSAAKMAMYPNARTLAIYDGKVHTVSSSGLTCQDFSSDEEFWRLPLHGGCAVARAKNALIVGFQNRIELFSPETGKSLWRYHTHSPVHGIALTRFGRLVVSTEQGGILCFGAIDSIGNATGELEENETPSIPIRTLPTLSHGLKKGLVARWALTRTVDRSATHVPGTDLEKGFKFRDQVASYNAEAAAPCRFSVWNSGEALEFDGTNELLISDGPIPAWVPDGKLSVVAWVRVDEPQTWGGIVSAVRDNGSDEQGWVLGYRGDKFAFGLREPATGATVGYCIAPARFQNGEWHQLVGVLKNGVQQLFVDGELAAQRKLLGARVKYPEKVFFNIGAFHDEDERFPLKGGISDVRIYDRELTPREIRLDYERQRGFYPARPAPSIARSLVPCTRFTTYGQASIQFPSLRTSESYSIKWRLAKSQVWLGSTGLGADDGKVVGTISDLRPRTLYQYALFEEQKQISGPWNLDTHFAYLWEENRQQDLHHRSNAFSKSLSQVLTSTRSQIRPISVVVSSSLEIAIATYQQTHSNTILLCAPEQVKRFRSRLAGLGLNGLRIAVMPFGDGLPQEFANVVIVDDASRFEEAWELVRPDGGVALLKEDSELDPQQLSNVETIEQSERCTIITKGKTSGAGAWTHMYGTPGNTHFAGEELGRVSAAEQLTVQWIGRPGPRHQSDRQNRKPSPLYSQGRLFIQGDKRILALDGHNGQIQWTLEIPDLIRFNVPRDCSNWCADGESVFVAIGNACWRLDGRTGSISNIYNLPGADQEHADWGYLATVGGQLIGTRTTRGASYTDLFGSDSWYDKRSGPLSAKVVSHEIFSLDPGSGKRTWSFNGHTIINSSISVSDGRIFFCCVPGNIADQSRLLDSEASKQLRLIGLNLSNGQQVFEQPLAGINFATSLYTSVSGRRIVLSASDSGKFDVRCLSFSDGSEAWKRELRWEANHHGKHLARPAISGDKIFLRPYVIELASGELKPEYKFPGGHTCASYTLTSNCMFLRAGNMTMWSFENKTAARWRRLRSDCWISQIPAGGLLLMPEGGGGCSCGSWLETSLAFRPRSNP